MAQSTLEQIADLLIQRTMWEARETGDDPAEALARACPFADDAVAYAVWIDRLAENGVDVDRVDAVACA